MSDILHQIINARSHSPRKSTQDAGLNLTKLTLALTRSQECHINQYHQASVMNNPGLSSTTLTKRTPGRSEVDMHHLLRILKMNSNEFTFVYSSGTPVKQDFTLHTKSTIVGRVYCCPTSEKGKQNVFCKPSLGQNPILHICTG